MPAVGELTQEWQEELSELLRIPSISADPERQDDVRAAGQWVVDRIVAAGGEAELVDWPAPGDGARPLAIGEIRASENADSAPTVLLYGHFDVQPPVPLDLWDSPPFEPEIRGEWMYARGIADDKGQLWMLLKAAETLAAEGALPVNLRFACDGEEEIGGHSVVDWLADDERGADAAVVFDSGMQRRGAPELNLAVRGLNYFHLKVRTGERDLHSGMYGGVSLNALHALLRILSAVTAGEDGRLPEPLRAGIVPASDEELAGWAELQPGLEAIEEQGSRPMDAGAGDGFYVRTWAEPAVDVHGIAGGSPTLVKTVLPVEAEANVSIRLAPGQDPVAIGEAFQQLLRDAAPEGAELTIEQQSSAPPGLVSPDAKAVSLAQDAFETATGVRPLLVRSGGSIPLVPALAGRGIPTIVTGFALPDSNIHSPNERLLVEYLPLGVETARELFRRFADLDR